VLNNIDLKGMRIAATGGRRASDWRWSGILRLVALGSRSLRARPSWWSGSPGHKRLRHRRRCRG
jgi:hypothetical protein